MIRFINIAKMPMLAIKLNPIKLRAWYMHTQVQDNEKCTAESGWEKSVEYGDFIDQCVKFDSHQYDAVISLLEHQLAHASDKSDFDGLFQQMRAMAKTSFELHCERILEFYATEMLAYPAADRVEKFRIHIEHLTRPTGSELLHLLSAHELLPFNKASESDEAEAMNRQTEHGVWPPIVAASTQEIIILCTNYLDRTINDFIWHMMHHRLYLHRCAVCGRWFVRTHKHKSAFCGGGFCLTAPQNDAKKRYIEKVERSPHWLAYHKAYNMWAQRKNKGKISPEQCAAWRKEAALRRDKVDKGQLSQAEYETWLKLCADIGKSDLSLLSVCFWESDS